MANLHLGQKKFCAALDVIEQEQPANDDDDIVAMMCQQGFIGDANFPEGNNKGKEYYPLSPLLGDSRSLLQNTIAIAAGTAGGGSPTCRACSHRRRRPQKQGQRGEEEACLIPEDRRTTRDLHRVEERMSRTKEVKDRLGPIVERLKASLVKIHTLEASLRLGNDESYSNDVGSDNCDVSSISVIRHQQSRKLMHQSMEKVKNKLLMLKNLEDRLTFSEDRGHNLQHHFLQVALSQSKLELATANQRNMELHDRIDELEHEIECWEQKAALVDDLQLRTTTLHGQLQEANVEKSNLESELGNRQTMIQQQSIRCKDLECQVDQLTATCDELMRSLRQQEDRSSSLEQELLDTRNYERTRQRSRSAGPPRTIQPHGRRESITTMSTCPTAASDHSTTTSGDNSSSSGSGSVGDENASSTSMEEGSSSTQNGMDTIIEGDSREIANEDNGGSFCNRSTRRDGMIATEEDDGSLQQQVVIVSSRGDDPEAIMIQTLMAKIENLDRENAELRESKYHALGKFKALHHEMKMQASTIQELQQKLNHQASLFGTPQEAKEKHSTNRIESKSNEQPQARVDTKAPEALETKKGFFKRLVTHAAGK